MQTAHILIVDNDVKFRKDLRNFFTAEGYEVYEAHDGVEMQQRLAEHLAHLVIMDIDLPGKNGLLLARELREQANTPLIFLTERDSEIDRILGLEIGADYYMKKPCNLRELAICTRNLLLRSMHQESVDDKQRQVEQYKFNGWTLEVNSRSLISPSEQVFKLPRSEFRAMQLFCEHPGKIHSRAVLLKKMTNRELKAHDRTVDVTIRRIRKHFESEPDSPEIIVTIHGEGYRFCGDLQTA